MPEGYCTLEDVRRALRKVDLPGDAIQDPDIAIDAVAAETEPLEKELKQHWYAPTGASILDEADQITIPTAPKTRDDEHDLPTHGGFVHGDSEFERHRYSPNSDALLEAGPRHERRRHDYREPKREIRVAIGEYHDGYDDRPAYTRLTLDRRDADAVNKLLIIDEDGSYTDWVAESDYDGGVGLTHRGEDYWVRLNNGGVSELYIDIHSLADDIASLSNAVYVDFDYGHEGIPRAIRRAVALRAAAYLAEEAVIEIPQNATLYNIETKAEEMRDEADRLLKEYRREELE
jgi:hypothetical protein